MTPDLKGCIELLSAAKGWDLDVLAVFMDIDHTELISCMESGIWSEEIEAKVMEHFVDILGTNREGFRPG